MRILFIGDVMGRPGRETVRAEVHRLIREYRLDLVVANGENAAGRAGITPAVADELFEAGVDLITLGDHAWDRPEIRGAIDTIPNMVRPANYPGEPPGLGCTVIEARNGARVAVAALLGRVFMPITLECPFRWADRLLRRAEGHYDLFLLDFHAEATSEKAALAWYLDGRVAAVVGTHTHVQTADERVLPRGTAFITDVGMTGPADSVIGAAKEAVIERFLTQMPVRLEVAGGARQLSAVILELDPATGRATRIERLLLRREEPDPPSAPPS